MVNILFLSATSACFELINTAPYYAPEKFEVQLNGEPAGAFDTNVFSLFSLQPDTAYEMTLRGETLHETLTFRTAAETCVIDVHTFGAVGDGCTDDTTAIQMAVSFLHLYLRQQIRRSRINICVTKAIYRTAIAFRAHHRWFTEVFTSYDMHKPSFRRIL